MKKEYELISYSFLDSESSSEWHFIKSEPSSESQFIDSEPNLEWHFINSEWLFLVILNLIQDLYFIIKKKFNDIF